MSGDSDEENGGPVEGLDSSVEEAEPDSEDAKQDEAQRSSRSRRMNPKRVETAREVFVDLLPSCANSAGSNLRDLLKTKISVEVRGQATYLVDWSQDDMQVEEIGESTKTDDSCKTSIVLDESTLLGICHGQINPQVAMLSDKVLVRGNAEPAVYLFNLFA